MSDRIKMALLCLLLVTAFAIWRKPGHIEESGDTADIFHDTREEFTHVNVTGESSVDPKRMKLLQESSGGEATGNPF